MEGFRGADVSVIARGLGLTVTPPRGSHGGMIYGCPACGAETRHTQRRDRRGAIGIRQDGTGWRCYQCDASGDALNLIALVLGDAPSIRDLAPHRRDEVRDWCQAWLGEVSQSPHRAVPAGPARRPPPSRDRGPGYPPEGEVKALWEAAGSVLDDPEVAAYLQGRRIDPVAVHDLDLARALTASARTPRWAYCGGRWPDVGLRILVPMVDAQGRIRSLRAKRLSSREPKTAAPKGYRVPGLVMACPMARQILASGGLPEWWIGELGPDRELTVVIAEGDPDFLTEATTGPEPWSRHDEADAGAPAVIGIVEGAWNDELASRIPPGAVVVIATDQNTAGERYAEAIGLSVVNRARRVERWRPAGKRGAA